MHKTMCKPRLLSSCSIHFHQTKYFMYNSGINSTTVERPLHALGQQIIARLQNCNVQTQRDFIKLYCGTKANICG